MLTRHRFLGPTLHCSRAGSELLTIASRDWRSQSSLGTLLVLISPRGLQSEITLFSSPSQSLRSHQSSMIFRAGRGTPDHSISGFLSLGAVDIWDGIILCSGDGSM